MGLNDNLHKAKTAKNDEFYTQLTDIEKELRYYKKHFEGKTVFCNCDDPEWSNFWKFFQYKFYELGLRKLVSTHYEPEGVSYKLEIIACEDKNGQLGIPDYIKTPLQGNGDFRSQECVEILKEADVVVTNPPFSLFREYVAQLVEYNKKFIIIGNINAITYKEIFPLIKNNELWAGYNKKEGTRKGNTLLFGVPESYEAKSLIIGNDGNKYAQVSAWWFTNLDIDKRHEELILYKSYTPEEYPQYDNYDAINVDKTVDIPCDYVPCWFKCNHACDCEYAKNSGFEGQALCEVVTINSVDAGAEQSRAEQSRAEQSRAEQSRAECLYCSAGQTEWLRKRRNGIMGVPITFLDKFCPEQFELIWTTDRGGDGMLEFCKQAYNRYDAPVVKGKGLYKRILIRRKM